MCKERNKTTIILKDKPIFRIFFFLGNLKRKKLKYLAINLYPYKQITEKGKNIRKIKNIIKKKSRKKKMRKLKILNAKQVS